MTKIVSHYHGQQIEAAYARDFESPDATGGPIWGAGPRGQDDVPVNEHGQRVAYFWLETRNPSIGTMEGQLLAEYTCLGHVQTAHEHTRIHFWKRYNA